MVLGIVTLLFQTFSIIFFKGSYNEMLLLVPPSFRGIANININKYLQYRKSLSM